MIRQHTKTTGFTLIELVIVVVLLGILAAVALPRYMNFTGEARDAVVKSTVGAFNAGLGMAHARWQLSEATAGLVDLDKDGKRETLFNDLGWPVGISADGESKLSELADGGVMGNDACSQIFKTVLNTTGLVIIAANNQGQCTNGDICAKSTGQQCNYLYRSTKETIIYDSSTGVVQIDKPAVLKKQ